MPSDILSAKSEAALWQGGSSGQPHVGTENIWCSCCGPRSAPPGDHYFFKSLLNTGIGKSIRTGLAGTDGYDGRYKSVLYAILGSQVNPPREFAAVLIYPAAPRCPLKIAPVRRRITELASDACGSNRRNICQPDRRSATAHRETLAGPLPLVQSNTKTPFPIFC